MGPLVAHSAKRGGSALPIRRKVCERCLHASDRQRVQIQVQDLVEVVRHVPQAQLGVPVRPWWLRPTNNTSPTKCATSQPT